MFSVNVIRPFNCFDSLEVSVGLIQANLPYARASKSQFKSRGSHFYLGVFKRMRNTLKKRYFISKLCAFFNY